MKINSLINHHFNYYIEYTIQLENYYLFNLFEASKYLRTYYAGQKLITKISDKLDKKEGILRLIGLNRSANFCMVQILY